MSDDTPRLTKVVYFDEESASDLLDMTAGGTANTNSEHVKTRARGAHAKTEAKLEAKLSWLPFIGVKGGADAGVDVSRASQSILTKTLSNTILTDYLREFEDDDHISRLTGYTVQAVPESLAWMKMYTPYLMVVRDEQSNIDPTKLDDALTRAKGYYELLAVPTTLADDATEHPVRVLRFNINAFRNNYGLIDLSRMDLIFHAIRVGQTTLANLNFNAEMGSSAPNGEATIDALLDEEQAESVDPILNASLDVYDVILAGVQHAR